jgi:hypothetical protein
MDQRNNNNTKEKVFYHFMLLYFLFATTLDVFSQKIYVEKEGIVWMEAENTTSPLDLWITSTTFSTFSRAGHLEFSEWVVTGSGPPLSPLVYKFKINEGGEYVLNVSKH